MVNMNYNRGIGGDSQAFEAKYITYKVWETQLHTPKTCITSITNDCG